MANIISIDIGSKNIKLIEGRSDKNSLLIKKAVKVLTPLTAVSEGHIKDYEGVRNILRQALTSNSIRTKNAVFNINTTSMITRTVELPILKNHDEIVQMIRYELEQFLPVVLDEYKIVYRIIKTYTEDNIKKGSYLIYAVPTKLINDYSRLAADLGLKLSSIDLSFNALEKVFTNGRIVNGHKIEKDKAYYVLELGHRSIIFNVMFNGNNLFTRLINLGGADLDVTIENMFDVNNEKAIKIKHKFANLDINEIETNEEASVNNVITTTVGEWLTEIRRIIQYFESRNKDVVIDGMFLFGGSSQIKNIGKYFKENLDIDAVVVTEISGFAINTHNKSLTDLNMAEYLDAIAGLLKKKTDMNLLSDLIKYKKKRLQNVFTGSVLFGAIALALIFYYIGYFVQVSALNNQIKYYDGIINNEIYQQKYREVAELENKINILKQYKDTLAVMDEQLSREDLIQSELLHAISSTVPIDINIASLTLSGNSIQLQGSSILRESIAQLEKNLKELEFIDTIHVPSITKEASGLSNYSFAISLTMKEVE
ncbi:MAG: type IV pilus assembly protein PilM [Tissierellales bacterium]|nr:type IV pilus assembly protein PilM [Tissierellales bacterium]MBN2826874.1 type IV pilus assembly protein PilM [Tissierellales bacterium]